ncbi:hypothetical protein CVT25_002609 [Psilocybe cyanescens]|uniref:Uncharacterized protein n=1 Tax=Psilocybe cyanescens TaxID=93625 RepID=A0A409WLN7_PSICY|nr:hypothetical protein CVT25_002609 [Psilocybe cyanescens]
MRLSAAASLSILALAGSCSADRYFSAGWAPGQQVQQEAQAETATYVPQASQTAAAAHAPKSTPFSFSSFFSVDKLLTSEPAVALFNTFGINITDRVNAVINVKLWDERVELITDENYKDLVVNEPLTEEEEKERVWVIVISVTSARQEGVSKFMDEVFDDAYNQTQIAGDLPHVRWGRIDYLNVTAITTKWGIWQYVLSLEIMDSRSSTSSRAPYLVVLKDRGQSLRFYRPYQIRLRADALREFLQVDGWKYSQPWSSSFAPGGKYEFVMEFMSVWFTKVYNYAVRIPKFLMVMISGGIGSLIIGLLHKPSARKAEAEAAAKAKAKAKAQAPAKPIEAPPAAPTTTTAAAAATDKSAPNTDSEVDSSAVAPRRTSTRQRKTKK